MSKGLLDDVIHLRNEIKVLKRKNAKYEENFKVLVSFLNHQGLKFNPFTKKVESNVIKDW